MLVFLLFIEFCGARREGDSKASLSLTWLHPRVAMAATMVFFVLFGIVISIVFLAGG